MIKYQNLVTPYYTVEQT